MYTFDWLAKQTTIRPDKIALIDAATGRRFTYRELHERASRVGAHLRDDWGVQPGDRVAILAHNSSDYFEVLYGCAKIGALLVCLNWRLATPELAYIVGDAQPVGLLYDAEFAAAAAALVEQFGIAHTLTMGDAYEARLAAASATPIVMPPTPLDAPWFLLYTSGTTGRPKGVVQTHGMVFYNGLNIGQPIGLTHADVTLNLLPFFHTGRPQPLYQSDAACRRHRDYPAHLRPRGNAAPAGDGGHGLLRRPCRVPFHEPASRF